VGANRGEKIIGGRETTESFGLDRGVIHRCGRVKFAYTANPARFPQFFHAFSIASCPKYRVSCIVRIIRVAYLTVSEGENMRHGESLTEVSLVRKFATTPPGKSQKLLWVDDALPMLMLYKAVFERLGFQVQATCSPYEALDHLSSRTTDVAILDYEMPQIDGCALAWLIRRRCLDLPVILYSGSISIPPNAHRWVDAVCSKAAPRKELLATIAALTRRALGKQRRACFPRLRAACSQSLT
jgi:CheY-like chemotaxis protein